MIAIASTSQRALVPYRPSAGTVAMAAPAIGARAVLPASHAAAASDERPQAGTTPRRRRDDRPCDPNPESALLTQFYASRRRLARVSAHEGAAAYRGSGEAPGLEAGFSLALTA